MEFFRIVQFEYRRERIGRKQPAINEFLYPFPPETDEHMVTFFAFGRTVRVGVSRPGEKHTEQKYGGRNDAILCKQLLLTKITFDGYTFE